MLAASVAALGSSLSDRTDVEIKEPRKKKRKKEKTKKRKEKEELLEKGDAFVCACVNIHYVCIHVCI